MSKQHYDQNKPDIASRPGAANQPPVGNVERKSNYDNSNRDSGKSNEGIKSTLEKAGNEIKSTVGGAMREANQSDPHNRGKKEGPVAKTIESQTVKIPSDVFLWTSFACMGLSLTLKLMKQNSTALFVGQWTTPFLIMGVYNKIVKTMGSE
jgi:hypothetical protein